MGFHFQSKGFTLSLHLMFLQIHPMESRDEGYKILLMKFFLPGTQNIFQKQKQSSSSSVSRTSWRPPPSCPGCWPGPPARTHRIHPRALPACSRTLSAAPPPLHAASTLCKILNWCSHWPCSCHLWDLITWNRRHWSLYSTLLYFIMFLQVPVKSSIKICDCHQHTLSFLPTESVLDLHCQSFLHYSVVDFQQNHSDLCSIDYLSVIYL